MKFTVLWTAYAEQNLARLWLEAADKDALAAAVATIDRALAADPIDAGESRDPGEHIHFELPLAVKYRVRHADRKVLVFAIWRVPSRHQTP